MSLKILSTKHLNFKQISLSALLTFSIGISQAEDVSQVVDHLAGKAINTIETSINEFANDVANSFGNGNTEISISNVESGKLDYSIKTIQPLTTPNKDNKEIIFTQGSIGSSENEGDRRTTINLGIGKRILVEDDKSVIGANAFVDYERTSKHKRASLGLEYKRSSFSAIANKYWALSDKKVVDGRTEEALSGYDVRVTGQMPHMPWARVKGTHYYWDNKISWDKDSYDSITGNIVGLELDLSSSARFEIGSELSNTMDRTAYGKLTVRLPFDDNEKITAFKLDSALFRSQDDMSLELLEMVERSNKIKIKAFISKNITFNGLTYKTIMSPDTGRVWLDRNLGAAQVCSSSTDSDCYGYLYQWGRNDDGHESRTSSNTTTLASSITPGTSTFVKNSTSPYDWTSADSSGASRTSAWANNGANDICPAGFSVPTEDELKSDTTSATTTDITNSATAFSSFLKLPLAGYRSRIDAGIESAGSSSYYWSRSVSGTDAPRLGFDSTTANFITSNRTYGLSVRCIKD